MPRETVGNEQRVADGDDSCAAVEHVDQRQPHIAGAGGFAARSSNNGHAGVWNEVVGDHLWIIGNPVLPANVRYRRLEKLRSSLPRRNRRLSGASNTRWPRISD